MTKNALLGLCAGLMSALLFASAATGPLVAKVLLFLIAPLPIFIAGLSFGWISAVIGGITGAIALALLASPTVGLGFGIVHVIPAAILCYLAQLNRAPISGPEHAATIEWYPIGRIVLWTAALAAGITILSLLMIGQDFEVLQSTLRSTVEKLVEQQIPKGKGDTKISPADISNITEVLITLMPAFLAVSVMSTLLINLWLAARISISMGRLFRPWPDLAAMTFPPGTPLFLAATFIAAAFLTNYAGLAASAISGSLYLAYVLLGLAVIHYITRTQTWRPILLWFVYAGLIIANTFVSPIIAIIGLIEPFSPFNRNLAPPDPNGNGGNPPQHP